MIRTATAADIPAAAAIYDEAVRTGTASFELEPPGAAVMLARFERLSEKGFPYIVADAGGVVAGFAYAAPYRDRPAYAFTVENSVYVHPDWRGRGIGRALLTALITRAEMCGFRQMVAVIGDSANGGSIALHAACGFEMTGTLKAVGRKFGRWLDTPIMQRELGTSHHMPPDEEPGPGA
jgi:L-amino acid N-acyltransferase YncA